MLYVAAPTPAAPAADPAPPNVIAQPATATAVAPACEQQPSISLAGAAEPLVSSAIAATAASSCDALMSSSVSDSSRPATPALCAAVAVVEPSLSATGAAATSADAAATAPLAAPATKRSRWGGAPTAASAVAAAAAAVVDASAAMVAAAASPVVVAPLASGQLALLPPSSADSSAAAAVPCSSPPVLVSDPSTALVPLGGGGGGSSPSGGGGAVSRKSRFSATSVNLSFDHSLLLSYHPASTLPRNFQLHIACAGMTTARADAFLAHVRLEAMDAQLRALNAGRPIDEVDPQPIDPETRQPRARSPSPEPVYDNQGVRTNTRVNRLRLRLLQAQKRLVADTLARTPGGEFAPPRGYRSSAAARLKFEAQRVVPLDLYPDYNFKGVIIGARGDHQKELEKRTGCKIAVRGRGSWSDSRPDSVRKHWPDDDAPQYVSIVADSEESLARGIAEVEKLLVPMNEEQRRKSLQALAEKNGWLSAPGEEYGVRACRVCGSKEHLMKSCPDRNGGRGYLTAAGVSCRFCGSRSHPTLDCAQARGLSRKDILAKLQGQGQGGARSLKDADERIDEEYELFMTELLGDGSSASSSASAALASSNTSGGGALFSSVARGSNGAQLALAPTSREEATLASLQQQQAKSAAPSFREYTSAQAHLEQARELDRLLQSHPVVHALVHSSNGWSTTTFFPAPAQASHAPPLPPAPFAPLPPAHSPFPPPPPPVHAHYNAHSSSYGLAPYPPPLPTQPHYL